MNYPCSTQTGAPNLRQRFMPGLGRRHLRNLGSSSGDWYIGSLVLYLLCVAIVFVLVASPSLLVTVK